RMLATLTATSGARSRMMRPSMSPLMAMSAATPFRRYVFSSMDRSPIFVGAFSDSANTASAALMNGWMSSILMSDVLLQERRGHRQRQDHRPERSEEFRRALPA